MDSYHSEDFHPDKPEPHYVNAKRYRPEPMAFVMWLHHDKYPEPPQSFRHLCGCGYTICKASTRNVLVANDIGLPWSEYEPGQDIIEIECGNCHSKYKILYQ